MLTARQLFGFLRSEQAQEASSERTIKSIQDSITKIREANEQQGYQTKALSVFTAVTTAFLPLSFCTSVGCSPPTISVFSNKKPYQYFGMNNIKEFNNNPISRDEFWSISGPICAGITLLAVIIVLGSEAVARFRQDSRVKLRKKIVDIESPRQKQEPWNWRSWRSREAAKPPLPQTQSPA